MNIIVLNGSPKGMTSVTMQYVKYIQKKFKQHNLKIFNISQKMNKIEKDEEFFQEILDNIKDADGVLWASPVYYLLVPSNYKRFIELILEKEKQDYFKGKYTAFLSSSIHFFDHTAHNYIHSVCDDLDMKYVSSFSADMYDLKKPEEQEKLSLFAKNFFDHIENNSFISKSYMPVVWNDFEYTPGPIERKINAGNKKVLVITDGQEQDKNLNNMTKQFVSYFSSDIEVINLSDLKIKGSCLGCIQCGYDNKCVYEDKDEYIDFYNNKVIKADILIWAGTIKDRYLSAKWKQFFDRSFFKGHTPSLMEKQIGLIISGPLNQVSNLWQVLEAYVELQKANFCGFVTDESEDSQQIDNALHGLAKRLVWSAENNYIKPSTFLGIGGIKLFRDEIWGRLRFPFWADYTFYKQMGIYDDFPQKDYKNRVKNSVMLFLSKSPVFRKEVNKRIKKEMIKPLEKIIG